MTQNLYFRDCVEIYEYPAYDLIGHLKLDQFEAQISMK